MRISIDFRCLWFNINLQMQNLYKMRVLIVVNSATLWVNVSPTFTSSRSCGNILHSCFPVQHKGNTLNLQELIYCYYQKECFIVRAVFSWVLKLIRQFLLFNFGNFGGFACRCRNFILSYQSVYIECRWCFCCFLAWFSI